MIELKKAAKKKRKAARAKKRLERQAKSEAKLRANSMELKEAKEAQKKKNILRAACKADVLSSEISLTDDEEAQVSNINAVALSEMETRRVEKERLKKKAKQHPTYWRLRGKYSHLNKY